MLHSLITAQSQSQHQDSASLQSIEIHLLVIMFELAVTIIRAFYSICNAFHQIDFYGWIVIQHICTMYYVNFRKKIIYLCLHSFYAIFLYMYNQHFGCYIYDLYGYYNVHLSNQLNNEYINNN